MDKPLVSIIIIEYFSIDHVDTCIKSIHSTLRNLRYEVIVSSNSCYDSAVRIEMQQKLGNVKISFNDRNGGYAYGMNQGLKLASGDLLVITNPDVIILSGFDEMVSFMLKNDSIGAAGPHIINHDGRSGLSFRKYISLPRLIGKQILRILRFRRLIPVKAPVNPTTVDWLSGAFMVVKREAYVKTKGLDEGYFLYAEDVDWCTRIRLEGFEIAFFPGMRIGYSGSHMAHKMNTFTMIFLKSHLRYWRKFGFIYGYPKRRKIVFSN